MSKKIKGQLLQDIKMIAEKLPLFPIMDPVTGSPRTYKRGLHYELLKRVDKLETKNGSTIKPHQRGMVGDEYTVEFHDHLSAMKKAYMKNQETGLREYVDAIGKSHKAWIMFKAKNPEYEKKLASLYFESANEV